MPLQDTPEKENRRQKVYFKGKRQDKAWTNCEEAKKKMMEVWWSVRRERYMTEKGQD